MPPKPRHAGSRRRIARGGWLRLAVGFTLWWCATAAAAAQSVRIELLPAEPALFEPADGGRPCAPTEGEIGIVGRFSDARLAIRDISQIVLRTASGERIPLVVDRGSVRREFGRIIAFRMYAAIPARHAADGRDPGLLMAWGEQVSATNELVDGLRLEESRSDAYRGFVVSEVAPASAPEGSAGELTLTITAERGIAWHKYWYLIPLGLLFVLLSARKLSQPARRRA